MERLNPKRQPTRRSYTLQRFERRAVEFGAFRSYRRFAGSPCPFCGITMIAGGNRPESMSRDHLMPRFSKRPGVLDPENIIVACKQCNSLKSDWTLIEFLWWYPEKMERFNLTV